jgi:hypothetical protein
VPTQADIYFSIGGIFLPKQTLTKQKHKKYLENKTITSHTRLIQQKSKTLCLSYSCDESLNQMFKTYRGVTQKKCLQKSFFGIYLFTMLAYIM